MTEPNNPYQTPASDVIEKTENTAGTSIIPVSRPIEAGWSWIKDAFALFKPNAFLWIGLFLIYMVIILIAAFIPILGGLFTTIAGPLFIAGIAQCAYDQDTHGEFEIGTLFSGFSHQTKDLLISGLIFFGLAILCSIPMFIVITVSTVVIGTQDDPSQIGGVGIGMFLGVLVALVFFIPAMMAYWFAPVLIKLNGVKPLQAFKLSFFACLKNILPFLLYSLIAVAIVFISAIPLGLGLIVTMPVLMIVTYTSYKDIFSG